MGLFTGIVASACYEWLVARRKANSLRAKFAFLDGDYEEKHRIEAQGFPTGGRVRVSYCGGSKFLTQGIHKDGHQEWHGEIFMDQEAAVLGEGFYSHNDKDDTGIHRVIYNPTEKHFNVAGRNTSQSNGARFNMIWQRRK
jgi:hypothetical protein